MAESDFQRDYLFYAVAVLQQYFRARQDVYVSGDLLLYYEEGNPAAAVAPDVFVVLGAPIHDRHTYRLWQEPKAPDFVLEVTSRSTRKEDQGPKRELYRRLGVREYWQYSRTLTTARPTPLSFSRPQAGDAPVSRLNSTPTG